VCKKVHKKKHKKDCEEHLRLAAQRAAELHDETLFKQPPPLYEDCPICFLRRTPAPTSIKEMIEFTKKRVELGDVLAMNALGLYYANAQGIYGLPLDYKKALKVWHRAAELGFAGGAYYNIGTALTNLVMG